MRRFVGALAAAAVSLSGVAAAQTVQPPAVLAAKTYGFVPHAAFFSVESKPANLLDPQVFVADSSATAGPGPQNIAHAAGYRPAYGVDDPTTTLSNARGNGIGITLGAWLGAHGTAVLTPNGNATSVAVSFAGLVPRGRYSLFENHFTPAGVTFTPLDGTAKTNSFTASPDGTAKQTVVAPGAITHAEGVLLVFHSDGLDHGPERGEIGVNAHHQLIMRVP